MKINQLLYLLLLLFSSCQSLPIIVDTTNSFEDYQVPEYFKEQILKKEEQIKDILCMHKNVSSFIFFTDAHWEINSKHSPEIIRHIQSITGINNVFFGGDAITGSTNKEDALLDMAGFSSAFHKIGGFYPVVGNHDSNRITANKTNPDTWLADEVIYDVLFGQLEMHYSSNVCYGDNFYYYVDDSMGKTRYLCLDTGRYSLSLKERSFIASALNTMPHDWHVVIITHVVYNAIDWYDPLSIYIPEGIKPMIQIADAYNARSEYRIDENTVFNFSDATSHVDLILGGHIHRDFVSYSEGGIPMVALDCDCRYTYSVVGNGEGTINEQCVTAVIIDRDDGVIQMIRFGRGEDITIII